MRATRTSRPQSFRGSSHNNMTALPGGGREVRVLSRAFRENPGAAGEDSHSAVTRARAGSPQGQPAGTREPRGEKPAGHRYRRLQGNWSVRPSLRRRRRRRRSVAVAQQAEPPVVGRVVRVQIPPVTLLAGRRASVLGGQVRFEPSAERRSAADTHATTARPSSERSPKCTTSTTNRAFERTSRRRRGFPSEQHVKTGSRIVHGDKELLEKLGGNDLCPCGSGRRFQALLSQLRALRRGGRQELLSATDAERPNACAGRRRPVTSLSPGGNMRPRRRPTPHDRASGPLTDTPPSPIVRG